MVRAGAQHAHQARRKCPGQTEREVRGENTSYKTGFAFGHLDVDQLRECADFVAAVHRHYRAQMFAGRPFAHHQGERRCAAQRARDRQTGRSSHHVRGTVPVCQNPVRLAFEQRREKGFRQFGKRRHRGVGTAQFGRGPGAQTQPVGQRVG